MQTPKLTSLLKSAQVLKFWRSASTKSNNDNISPMLTNRNPRNLDRMRIGYKPDGYHLEAAGRRFWHKLELAVSGKYVKATVSHFENGVVVQASTQEWAMKKQLYRYKDTSAFINLGRVMAQRCLECGLTEMYCGIDEASEEGSKVSHFTEALKAGGISLVEPAQYKHPTPWDNLRPEKPWEVTD